VTPKDFIAKWRNVELKERTASHSHFNDLCRLLDINDPVTEDPKGDWFTFEKGASKTSGGEGWADVWRKNCFAWEYKGKRANLDKAFDQLLQYSIALENPPLLIVSDMDVIRVHTNWTNTVQNVHTILLDDLTDAANRSLLRNAFLDPEKLKPVKTRQLVTEQAAQNFANMAQRLRERGHDPQEVAHFINRLVFCMFAEDVELLPKKMFERMINTARPKPETFATHAKALFGAMKTGGLVGFETVEWFNGGLFDSDDVLPLEWEDLDDLIRASALDWSDIDPSILGTLFERGLDPAKRSQLGAHYTDRDKIMQIVNPVIVEPLLAEWAEVKAQIEAQLDKAPKATKAKLLSTKEKSAVTRALDKAKKLHLGFTNGSRRFVRWTLPVGLATSSTLRCWS
jgi:type II restriction/modification system DNA methylase subunit YeeA